MSAPKDRLPFKHFIHFIMSIAQWKIVVACLFMYRINIWSVILHHILSEFVGCIRHYVVWIRNSAVASCFNWQCSRKENSRLEISIRASKHCETSGRWIHLNNWIFSKPYIHVGCIGKLHYHEFNNEIKLTSANKNHVASGRFQYGTSSYT